MRRIPNLIAVSASAAVLSMAACGSGSGESGDNLHTSGPDTLSIAVMDTIGLEMGDSVYVFGMILKAVHGEDGSIVVLDMLRARLDVFDPEGTWTATVGAPGPGPGEFQMPTDFAVLPEDGFAVCDMLSQTVSLFDRTGDFTDRISDFLPSAPMRIESGPDGTLIGVYMPMEIDQDRVTASVDVARWPVGSPNPELTYMSIPVEMQHVGGGTVTGDAFPELELAVGRDGSVYVVEISDSLFSLRGFDPEGMGTFTLSEPMERIPISQEEMDAGTLGITMTIRDGEPSAGMERMENTDQWRDIVSSVGVDGQGRIWVEMACYHQPLFRVYAPDGGLLFLARPEADFPQVGRPEFRVDAGGILAYDRDPVDWPKVYLLQLAED